MSQSFEVRYLVEPFRASMKMPSSKCSSAEVEAIRVSMESMKMVEP